MWQDVIFMENTPGYDESLLEAELGALALLIHAQA